MGYKNIGDRRAYHRQYMKERRDFFRQHHLCTECGKEDAYTMAGHSKCFEHTHYRKKRPFEYVKVEKPVLESYRHDETRCYLCGSPVLESETAFSGRPLRVCEKHYEHMKKMGEKGRAAYLEKHGETWGNKQYTTSINLKEFRATERFLHRHT